MNILKSNFPQFPNFTNNHVSFFNELISLYTAEIDQIVGRKISNYVLDYVKNNSIILSNPIQSDNYVRTYIGRDPKTNLEALIMSWSKDNQTTIHSHPKFACYTFAEGEFLIEVFEQIGNSSKVTLKESTIINKPMSLYSIGENDTYDNHIHRITCLSETGTSLHIYSDDALKGLKFEL